MKNAYLYPNSKKTINSSNPYLIDFVESLSSDINFINISHPTSNGILDAFKYLGKVEIVFFNWIEDLPDKKGGILQTILLLLLLFVLKIKKIQIFYTLHNKESHYPTNKRLKKLIKISILKYANYILCHSSAGLEVLNQYKIPVNKFLYLPHPFNAPPINRSVQEKEYDILIWGAIKPYKGIDSFLKYLESKGLLERYKTLIIGKISPKSYENELNKYKSSAIQIKNVFIEDNELNTLIDKSRIILFTYNESSILSSGALIYTLSRGATVIGPNTAAFHDFFEEELIEVFNDYDELVRKINIQLNALPKSQDKLNEFISRNSWKNFAVEIINWMRE